MTITRARIEQLRVAIPLGVIAYSQSATNRYTGRRSDCSGLVSYVWDLPTSGPGTWLGAYSTESLFTQRLIAEIPRTGLQRGDAIGYCGPGSANGGGGHIALVLETKGDQVRVWDHGSGMGPKDRWVTWNSQSTGWLSPGKCKAWRYVGLAEDGGMIMYCAKGDKGPVVEGLQRLLLVAGAVLPKFGPDGDYGAETAAALATVVGGDGAVYGPAEYAALTVAVAKHAAGPGALVPHVHDLTINGATGAARTEE